MRSQFLYIVVGIIVIGTVSLLFYQYGYRKSPGALTNYERAKLEKEIAKSANDPYVKAQKLIREEGKLEEGLKYCDQVTDSLKFQSCYVAYTAVKIQRNEKVDKAICDKIESVKTAFTQDLVTDCLKHIK